LRAIWVSLENVSTSQLTKAQVSAAHGEERRGHQAGGRWPC
jgi:hypothetical protein